MSRMVCRTLPALLAALALVASCSGKKDALPGAVYANQAVSVYAAATYDGAIGGQSGDFEGETTTESVSWFFETKDPMEKVVAFYEGALPGATKEVGDSEVTFTLVPQGAESDEQVQVIVSPGRIQIHESTRPGKHTDPSCYDKTMDEMGLGILK